jgi:hypothetical protein
LFTAIPDPSLLVILGFGSGGVGPFGVALVAKAVEDDCAITLSDTAPRRHNRKKREENIFFIFNTTILIKFYLSSILTHQILILYYSLHEIVENQYIFSKKRFVVFDA